MTKLREHRKRLGMTLAELGFKAEVDEAFLCKAEHGWKKVPDEAQERISAVLGVGRGMLFEDSGRAKN